HEGGGVQVVAHAILEQLLDELPVPVLGMREFESEGPRDLTQPLWRCSRGDLLPQGFRERTVNRERVPLTGEIVFTAVGQGDELRARGLLRGFLDEDPGEI